MIAIMLEESRIRDLLVPFDITLDSHQVGQLSAYLSLLLRWNEKINLTSIRDVEECVTRHFGESLILARFEKLEGSLLDVGSGAGFPGLAIKIVFPAVHTTLLEPLVKKRAFLKEVIRACGFSDVEVRAERLDHFSPGETGFDLLTMRAVGGVEERIAEASKLLSEDGRLYLWLSRAQKDSLKGIGIKWTRWLELPMSRERGIITGVRSK